MDEDELQAWEDQHRHPHVRRAKEAWMNDSWNPTRHPGDRIGGMIIEDKIDPTTRKRVIVLAVPRRKRNVAVWISYPDLIQQIQNAAPAIGERLGITFIGEARGGYRYSILLPNRAAAETTADEPARSSG